MRRNRPAHGPAVRSAPVVAAAMLLGMVTAAAAPPKSPLKVVANGDNTQVIFDFPRHVGFGLQRTGNTLHLHFTKAGLIPAAVGDARNVTAVTGGMNSATIELAPGAWTHITRKGDRIMVEVANPGSPGPVPVAVPVAGPVVIPPVIAEALPPPSTIPVMSPAILPPIAAPAALAVVAPLPVIVPPPPAAPRPAANAPIVVAMPYGLPAGTSGSAAFLPFSARVGAAAFHRGNAAWVVFDERHRLDLSALQDDPLFSHAVVQVLTSSTLLRLPLEDGSELRLTRVDAGWRIAALRSAPPPAPIGLVAKAASFELPAAGSNDVVTVLDPDTGQNLLVGTLRGAASAVPVVRRVPAFVVEPTWLGVLVEPIADTVMLRTSADGFVVAAGDTALSPPPDAAASLAGAAFLTRRFEIPTGAVAMLLRRLQSQVNDAGAAPAQSRARPRKAAATTMIALGMGVEAQAMLHLATEEDPRLDTDAEATGLTAIAAMLGGRDAEADGITNPALDGSDEVAFWRAVRQARAYEGDPQAAAAFATTVNLMLAYPAPLRAAIQPLVVETMALGGKLDAADAVLKLLPNDPALGLARALQLENGNKTAAALTAYDMIATGQDRLQAARAANRATSLRLATGALTPIDAAAAFERQFMNWRGDARELDLRLRVAELRAEAGQWRPAFALLRETITLYPESAALIEAHMSQLMATLLKSPASASISPLELVALTEENAELVASVGSPDVTAFIADKLLALDLPLRADPVLANMMRAAPIGVGQATLGARLATLRLDAGDNTGAGTALANSNAPSLPADLIERRSLIAARIAAHTGHQDRALAILDDLGTSAAEEVRASLLTEAQDWSGAAAALMTVARKTVPPLGPLTASQQDLVLQLASALSRAGDAVGLAAIATQYIGRIDGQRTGMFRLLTEIPISTVADISRSSSEMELVKAIPASLKAIGSR